MPRTPRLSLLVLTCAAIALAPATASADPSIVNLTPPSLLSSDLIVGEAVEVSPGTWDPSLPAQTQWYSCPDESAVGCSEIPGATSAMYTPELDDKGRFLKAIETVTNEFDESETASTELVGPVAWGHWIVDNGTIGLGVRTTGSLVVPGGPESAGSAGSEGGESYFGLRLLDGMYESISPGSPAEGWGFADGVSDVSGISNRDSGDSNVEVEDAWGSIKAAGSSVIVRDDDEDPYARITHDFKSSTVSDFLYEVDITIEALQIGGVTQALYRRNVDWDIEPTPFSEVVSTVVGNSTALKGVSDDGFTSSNPLNELSSQNQSGEVFSNGPGDIGAAFDFDFGTIPYGTANARKFKLFYGAAPSRDELLGALEAAEVEAFSIASNSKTSGFETGEPAVFTLAFKDVGGSPVLADGAPTAAFTAKPPSRTTSTDAVFEFSSDTDGSQFECRLDEAEFEPCTSPVTFSNLKKDRNHKFFVRAISGDLTQTLPTSHTWNISDYPFGLSFSSVPSWWTSDTTATFELLSEYVAIDELEITCSLDGAAFAACSAAETFTGLTQDSHTLTMRATKGGVIEELSYEWTVSEQVMTRFTRKPRAQSRDLTPTFEWETGGEVDGVECKFDAGEWFDCGDRTEIDLRAFPGEHSFSIRARDAANNYQPEPTSWSWTVDRLDPSVTHNIPAVISRLPFNALIESDEPLAWADCFLDGADAVDCSDGLTLSDLSEGTHELRIEFEDFAGNSGELYVEFEYEEGAPLAKITSAPPKVTQDRTAKFEFTGPPGATFECELNDSGFEPCSSPATYDLLSNDESHEFSVLAIQGGRTQPNPTRHIWRIDSTPFGIFFDETPSNLTSSTEAEFAVDTEHYNGDLLTYSCSLDGAQFFDCADQFGFEDLAPGEHEVVVRATDLGVTEEIAFTWRIADASTATVVLVDTPRELTNSTDAEFFWERSAQVEEVKCRLDDGEWNPCQESQDHYLELLEEGNHTFEVMPYDDAGNPGVGDSFAWTVDTTAPVLGSGSAGSNLKLPAELTLTANEAIARTECTIDTEEYADCGWPIKLTYLAVGQHSITVTARDRAGNWSESTSFSFSVRDPAKDPEGPDSPQPTPTKPTISVKSPKRKASELKLNVVCPATECEVSGWVKAGKKRFKLPSKDVDSGKSSVTLKFSKKLARATRAARKGRSSYSVTIDSDGLVARRTGKF